MAFFTMVTAMGFSMNKNRRSNTINTAFENLLAIFMTHHVKDIVAEIPRLTCMLHALPMSNLTNTCITGSLPSNIDLTL